MQNTSYNIFIHQLNSWYDPEQIFVHFFGKEPYAFWLDSSKPCTPVVRGKLDSETSRFSYMGDTNGSLSKRIKYSVADGILHITKKEKTRRVRKSIFEYLEEQLKISNTTNFKFQISNGERIGNWKLEIRNLKFLGGFVGYLGYELQNECGGSTPYKSKLPDAYFFFADRVIAFDHLEKKVYLVCIADNKKEAKKWFISVKNVIARSQVGLGDEANPKGSANGIASPFSSFRSSTPRSSTVSLRSNRSLRLEEARNDVEFTLARNHLQYIEDIKTCQEYLRKGESYQICLTNSFSANGKVDWLPLYLTLRRMNPAPYSVFMRFEDFAVLSSSPEKFLSITPGGNVETKPIKGTRPRGKTKKEDEQFMQELLTSKKDWSENAMIVDLLRNDLGKVCEFGSIQVKKFLAVETYQTVHQLVSTIQGKLRTDMTVIDCVKACFPGGSMTGVPKKRTMEILSKLEKQARGIYSGALGFFSLDGSAALSIIIRTIIATKNQVTIGSGGAILIDSDPEKEYDEMLLKAKVLMEAINAL